jgi:hypothetical protein
MLMPSGPIAELVAQVTGVVGQADVVVTRQVQTRIPIECVAAVEALATSANLSKAQVYSRLVEAGLQAFRRELASQSPDSLQAFNEALNPILDKMLADEGGE